MISLFKPFSPIYYFRMELFLDILSESKLTVKGVLQHLAFIKNYILSLLFQLC